MKHAKTHVLYIGAGRRKRLPASVLRRASELYGGITAIPAYGCWVDPSTKKLVCENSVRVEIASNLELAEFVGWLKTELKQKEIILDGRAV